MKLRHLILSFFVTMSLANNDTSANNSTQEEDFFGENPYWDEVDRPCANKWMPMCFEEKEGYLFVPILCLCGQDSFENDFLIGFSQCLGDDGLTRGEINDAFVAIMWECSQQNLSVNMTKNEFIRIAEGGDPYPSDSSGLSTGAIAGVAVGAIAGTAGVAGLFVWLWFQRRKQNGSRLESNPPDSPKLENTMVPEFKPEWTANAPVELPPTNYAAAELPPESTPIYEMDAMPTKPVEMPGSIPEDVKKEEIKVDKDGQDV